VNFCLNVIVWLNRLNLQTKTWVLLAKQVNKIKLSLILSTASLLYFSYLSVKNTTKAHFNSLGLKAKFLILVDRSAYIFFKVLQILRKASNLKNLRILLNFIKLTRL
jgi:hypothetical protein